MGSEGGEEKGRGWLKPGASYHQRMPHESLGMQGELIVEKLPVAWVLILRGEHDVSTAHTLDAQLDAVLLHGGNVIVDLSDAVFIDSSTVGAVFRGLRYVTEAGAGAVVVCALPGSFPRRVLDQAGMIDAIQIFDHRRDAVAFFEAG